MKTVFHWRKLRKAGMSLVLAALAFFALVAQAAPDSILYFNPGTASVEVGDDFSLDAMIDPGVNEVTAVEIHVTFDPAILRLDGVSTADSPFSNTFQAASINNTNGTASLIVGVPATTPVVPVTTEAKIATFNFHSLDEGSGSSVVFESTSVASALGEVDDVITARNSASVTVTAPDVTAPSVTEFVIPATASSLTVAVTTFTANDAVGVTGYMLTETSAAPSSGAAGWTSSAPTSYTFSSAGNKTLYAWAKDEAGNVSTSLSDNVTITLPDTAAPVISGGFPSGTLAFGTTQTTLSVATNEDAICKYATSAGVDFDSMSDTFDTTGGTTHSKTLTGLTDATSYAYYIRCSDGESNKNQTDYQVSFSVDAEPVVEEEPDPQDAPAAIDIPKPKVKIDDEKKTLLSYFKDNKKIKFYGEIEQIAGGEVKINKNGKLSETALIDQAGKWEAKLKFKESTQVKLYFYDKEGNEVGTKKYRIRIDDEDPEFADLPLSLKKKPGDKIWWKATDNKKVDYYKYEVAGKMEKTENDFFYLPKDISKGPHTVKISAYDKAGNKAVRSVMVLVW